MPRDTDLHKMAYKGEMGGVMDALEDEDVDVNVFGAANRTPIHRAVAGNHPDIVKVLLEAGANVDIQDKSGRTPLHWASVVGSVSCAKILFDNGAQPNVKSSSGSTPLHMAADQGHLDFCIFLVEEAEADITLTDNGDMTAYDLAKTAGNKEVMLIVNPNPNQSEGFCKFRCSIM